MIALDHCTLYPNHAISPQYLTNVEQPWFADRFPNSFDWRENQFWCTLFFPLLWRLFFALSILTLSMTATTRGAFDMDLCPSLSHKTFQSFLGLCREGQLWPAALADIILLLRDSLDGKGKHYWIGPSSTSWNDKGKGNGIIIISAALHHHPLCKTWFSMITHDITSIR